MSGGAGDGRAEAFWTRRDSAEQDQKRHGGPYGSWDDADFSSESNSDSDHSVSFSGTGTSSKLWDQIDSKSVATRSVMTNLIDDRIGKKG